MLLLLDLDGVLTAPYSYVDESGNRSKQFSVRDNEAIRKFVDAGWRVCIVSKSRWLGIHNYMSSVPVEIWIDNPKTKESIDHITRGETYFACGDDILDEAMLDGAKQAFCPHDADPHVLSKHNVAVLETNGGNGCVVELSRILLC